jgi:hypothetical protein
MIYNQIQRLTGDIIAAGICNDQNYPNMKELPHGGADISISNIETNIYLKNVSYYDMYDEMHGLRAYNLKMIDGALILMQYRFVNEKLISHRLSFFPSPNLFSFQNEPELYLEDEIYADIVDRRVVAAPIRFDYDISAAVECTHPVSHMTLGQYKNCRIPVSAGVTPFVFLSFIIRNFYHTAHEKYGDKIRIYKDVFPGTILHKEKQLVYVKIPSTTAN